MSRVVVATIACDYKAYSLERVMRRNAELEAPEGVEKLLYLNVEAASQARAVVQYANLISELDLACDIWTWISTWRGKREKDQDQGYRLPAIVTARNMAREYAMSADADAILYIDSDVLAPRNSLARLWDLELPVVGGVVPGRGCHSHARYLGGREGREQVGEDLIGVRFATAGFVMIRRWTYHNTAWRHTNHRSEDSLYIEDSGERWHVATDLVAGHLDHPERPLTEEETADF